MTTLEEYNHKAVVLKCCISSSNRTKDKVTTRLASSYDWDKNLKFILSRIPKKFNFLTSLEESQWSLSINGIIIDKNDSKQFGQILSSIPPIPVIEIVETGIEQNGYVITVHHGNKQFNYKANDKDEWNNDTYLDLLTAIRKVFDLDIEFSLYEDVDGNQVDIDDMDDIVNGFEDDVDDDANDDGTDGSSQSKKLLHIFVKNPEETKEDDEKQTNQPHVHIAVLFNKDKVIIRKNKLIYNTTFNQLFKAGSIEHEFKDNDTVKETLITHQNRLRFQSYEHNKNTVIKYKLDYFDIAIKIPNHLFDIDLENCTMEQQLNWYKNKYQEHVRILTLNDYQLDAIQIDELEGSNFIFKIYKPDEIVYEHKGFTPPPRVYQNGRYNPPHPHKITKQEYQLNLLKSFYDGIKRKYGIEFAKFDNHDLEISTFLSENKIDVTKNKYFKKLNNTIYFIKNNASPQISVNVYYDRVEVSNLDLLYWKLEWMTCFKDAASYMIDLMDAVTADHIVTKLPVNVYLMDKTFESNVFVINIDGRISKTHSNSSYPQPSESTNTSFVISLLYKLVLRHQILRLEYIGAIQYYNEKSGTVYKKYDKDENIAIQFDATTKQQQIQNIAKYKDLAYYNMQISESARTTRYSNAPQYSYSYSITPNFPVNAVTLYLK